MTDSPDRTTRRAWPLFLAFVGLALVAAGVLLNPWCMAKLLSPDGSIGSRPLRTATLVMDLGCLVLGVALLRFRHRLPPPRLSLVNIAFLLVSTSAALVVAEVTLRAAGYRPWRPGIVGADDGRSETRTPYSVAHPTLGHTIQPGHIGIEMPGGSGFDAEHRSNRARATRPGDSEGDADHGRDIWIFGCSFAYGWGVEDHETFPWLLQELLPTFRVVNFAISGYSTLQAFMRFEESLAQSPAPLVALLAYASIQEERNVLARSWKKNLAQYQELSFIMHPYARLAPDGRLLRAHGGITYRALPGARHWVMLNALDDAINKVEVRLRKSNRVSQAIVDAFGEHATAHGVRPLVALLTRDPASRDLLDHCRRSGIPCVDVSVDLTEPKFTNLPSDPHPSPLAHRHYARAIHDFLMQMPERG